MILTEKTLEKLRLIINEETEYRSGPKLVQFFNNLEFTDSYGQGFPSRWVFTDEKLSQINGTPQLDICIKKVLSPANFIGRADELDQHIADFNQYLAFDKWKVIRDSTEICFQKLDKVEYDDTPKKNDTEDEFLKREFRDVTVKELDLENSISNVLHLRFSEIERCYTASSYLSVILLAGSTLEGVFLGLATKHPQLFNSSKSSPKNKENKVRQFHEWNLATFIDVAKDIGFIQYDTHKFSHALRDFRNYIHPFEQMSSGFSPRQHTAKLCLQVLKAVIYEVSDYYQKLK